LRLVFLGVPGAGKGTQAARLVQRLGAPHVSTGEMLRETAREDTPLARKLKEYMDSGGLVPDEMMNQVVEARLSRPDAAGGFVLDGYPRTAAQAEALGATLSRMKKKLDAVVFFNLPQGEAVKRLSGRRTCSSCGANYHVSFNPPMREGTCDNCGAKLYQRDDDKPEVIERRFEAYQERTSGLVVYYRAKGLLREVNASPGPDEIFSSVLDVLGLGE
jgi:adenylate kinase